MKKTCAALALILILSLMLCSCAENASASVEKYAADALPEGLDAYIGEQVKRSHIPGMSFEIVDGEDVLFLGNYGEAQSGDQPFILGSLSKSFTALAIMQLEEKGLLSLDDCVNVYLEEFDSDSLTTLRQLLTHTSGMKTSATMENYMSFDEPMPYTYSNQNYNLLGRIVEEVSGESYAEYIENHIFAPLDMTHSYTSLDEAKADGLIPGSRNYFGLYAHAEMPYPKNMTSGWMTLSSAYLISTANDMGKYLQFFLNDSHPEVLKPENRARLFTETTYAAKDYEYGLGWGINTVDGIKLYMHGGNVENYTTYMIIVPDRNMGIIALTNSCDFLVADGYTISIPKNVADKLNGQETMDIAEGDYVKYHLEYDAIMLVLFVLCCPPALLYKKWRAREHKVVWSAIFIAIVHIAIPTLMLTIFGILMDRPLYVVQRFAPDVFIILCAGAGLLYVTGILKVARLVKSRIERGNGKAAQA